MLASGQCRSCALSGRPPGAAATGALRPLRLGRARLLLARAPCAAHSTRRAAAGRTRAGLPVALPRGEQGAVAPAGGAGRAATPPTLSGISEGAPAVYRAHDGPAPTTAARKSATLRLPRGAARSPAAAARRSASRSASASAARSSPVAPPPPRAAACPAAALVAGCDAAIMQAGP